MLLFGLTAALPQNAHAANYIFGQAADGYAWRVAVKDSSAAIWDAPPENCKWTRMEYNGLQFSRGEVFTSGADNVQVLSDWMVVCGVTLYPLTFNGHQLTLWLGAGNDRYWGVANGNRVAVDGQDGADDITNFQGWETHGSAGDDKLMGTTGDWIMGGPGNDTIRISYNTTADTIDGGSGTDSRCGGGASYVFNVEQFCSW